ncbi:hypothetical protein [Flammeovirga pacifica]|uniref:Uncharacterized protein n=1 Tax=Flammeovirga pacifica TaxID=915059 RepID=A0A1S1YZC4_FLAPC|nr:hypothetical protein [Flammeovirga pacifica]OHX66283.1 hypothetical protein NH26_07910 [Flammeovirga pacifica]
MITSKQAEEQLQSLKASKEAAQLIWNSFEEGGITIHTPFELNGTSHAFTTLIQLDADVINYFPDVGGEDLTKYTRKMGNIAQRHWYEVEFAFYKLGSSRKLWYLLSDVILWVSNAITLLYVVDFNNILVSLGWFSIPFITAFFRKKVLKFLSPKLLRLSFDIKKIGEWLFKKLQKEELKKSDV